MSTVDDTIRELDARRIRAILENDAEAMAALCHPDFVYVHSLGKVDPLADYLESIRTGKRLKAENVIDSIISTDTAAFVSGRYNAEMSTPDGVLSVSVLGGLTWLLIDGEWKLVAARMSVAPKPAA
jgi:hypothetical protein